MIKKVEDITLEHDFAAYAVDPYLAENLVCNSAYVKYISQYKNSDENFLELGIGQARTINLLEKIFKNITVIDAEQAFIDKYKAEYKNINFVHSFFEEYVSHGQKFSNIGMGFMLDLVKEPNVILKKYSNLLEQNGRIFVSVPNASSFHRLLAHKAGLLEDIHDLSEIITDYGNLRLYDYDQWVSLFNKSGLKIVASHGLYFKPFTTQQINQLNLNDKVSEALTMMGENYPEISTSCFFVLTRDS